MGGRGEGGLVKSCVRGNVKELTCCREHLLAGDEETGTRKKMGTEWEKMGGQCGKNGEGTLESREGGRL